MRTWAPNSQLAPDVSLCVFRYNDPIFACSAWRAFRALCPDSASRCETCWYALECVGCAGGSEQILSATWSRFSSKFVMQIDGLPLVIEPEIRRGCIFVILVKAAAPKVLAGSGPTSVEKSWRRKWIRFILCVHV